MVDITNVINDSLNNTDWGGVLSKIPGFNNLVKVGFAIGILLIVYIIFLIIRSITQILYSLRFKRVAKNVEEINEKMDLLIDSFKKDKIEKKEEKKKK